jgi:hypothetical protein
MQPAFATLQRGLHNKSVQTICKHDNDYLHALQTGAVLTVSPTNVNERSPQTKKEFKMAHRRHYHSH